jgi:hypothetical protein
MTGLWFDAEEVWENSWTAVGDLDGWVALPRLEVLRIRAGAGGTLGTLDLPSLRTFEYESCAISLPEIESIAKAQWPKLQHLELWLGAKDQGAIETIAPLRPILDGEGLPGLLHLGLCNTELLDDLIPALAECPLLRQLTSLDLSRSTLVKAEELVRRAPAFRHLTWISLEENLLSDIESDLILEALPNARIGDQRYDDYADAVESYGEDAGRYVALSE